MPARDPTKAFVIQSRDSPSLTSRAAVAHAFRLDQKRPAQPGPTLPQDGAADCTDDDDACLDCFLEFLDKQICGTVLSSGAGDLLKSSQDFALDNNNNNITPVNDDDLMVPKFFDSNHRFDLSLA